MQEIDKQVRANIKCTQKVMVTLLLNEDKNGSDTLYQGNEFHKEIHGVQKGSRKG